MSGNTCSYNCFIDSQAIPSYPDISGIGVIVGYVVTAFFVVVITSSYYLFTYQPNLSPFRKGDDTEDQITPSRYRSNPIDKIILSTLAKWLPRKPEGNGPYSRLEKALTKCVLNMSDLQIITGLSILISGFIQLRCGLSAYHWQIMVYLAWFSSITHLCCLTFLRNYLFNHPGQRLWRLVSMFIIIIMLVVALVPTRYFDLVSPGSSAICYFGRLSLGWSAYPIIPQSYLTMILSSSLLILGFLTRVIRLHKVLSIDFILRMRSWLSKVARRCLWRVYAWCQAEPNAKGLRRSLVYHPLLACFFMLRVSLDVYSSMFMEVWWLLAGFTWGTIHLVLTLNLSLVGIGNSDWTFGQVVPVVLLAAPAIAVVEFFYEDDEGERHVETTTPNSASSASVMTTNNGVQNQARLPKTCLGTTAVSNAQTVDNAQLGTIPGRRTETLQIVDRLSSVPIEGLRDEPDFDFYVESSWFVWIVIYTLCSTCTVSVYIIVSTYLGQDFLSLWLILPAPQVWWTWIFLSVPLTFWCFILLVLAVEDLRLQIPEFNTRDWVSKSVHGALTLYFLFQLVVFAVGLPSSGSWIGASYPLSWLWVVVPIELHIILAGLRARTVLGLLVVVLVAASFMGVMIWSVHYAPWLHDNINIETT